MNDLFLALPVLFFSVIFHECAHGYIAYRLGDPTARNMGRITFNPIPHIDPIMTILLPLLVYFSSGGHMIFGGAKPVPINPLRFRRDITMRKGIMLTALAGPASNFLLIIICLVLYKVLYSVTGGVSSPTIGVVAKTINLGILVNFFLMAFNLLPIPPLDGSKILAYFLPRQYYNTYMSLNRFGFLLLVLLLWVGFLEIWFIPFKILLGILWRLFGIA